MNGLPHSQGLTCRLASLAPSVPLAPFASHAFNDLPHARCGARATWGKCGKSVTPPSHPYPRPTDFQLPIAAMAF